MSTTPPRKAARAAFDQLDTSEKTGFIFEATFSTIGQALEETGRRVADVVESFTLDDLFTAEPIDDPAPPPKKKASPRAKTTPSARKASRKPTSKKPAAKKTPPPKTAGKAKPKTDDDA